MIIREDKKTVEELLEEFPFPLGDGAYKVVFSNKDYTKVLKTPRISSDLFFRYREEIYGIDDCAEEEEVVLPPVIFEFDEEKGKYFFDFIGEDNKMPYFMTDIVEAFYKEFLTFLNADTESKEFLAEIYELGFTDNNIPYIIAEQMPYVFSEYFDNAEEECNRVVSSYYFDEETEEDFTNFLLKDEDTVFDVIFREMGEKDSDIIDKVKENFTKAVYKLGLNYCEQIDNWNNIGFDLSKKKVVMIDYA